MSLTEDVLALLSSKGIIYLREAQVLLENPPQIEHWYITSALNRLKSQGRIRTRMFKGNRWFYLSNKSWDDIRVIALKKSGLVRFYSNWDNTFTSDPEGIKYDDYSEYLVERALVEADFTVVAKSTNYFNGRQYRRQGALPGRPPDLDFIVLYHDVSKAVGVSVKNKLDYPTDDEINMLLEICEVLKVKPVLITRMVFGRGIQKIYAAGGRAILFKRWLLRPPMANNRFLEISDAGKGATVLGLPASIYRYVPEMLIEKCREARNVLFEAI